jgi:dethiobiotin synthetase
VGGVSQIRYGVTGTDTGVGKTVVSCALLARARQLGMNAAAMKPIETGVVLGLNASDRATDAARLRRAGGDLDSETLIRPYVLTEALAPMVAAARAGTAIDFAVLDDAYERLSSARDLMLIEGAGGLLVPITPTVSFADLFMRWQCALIIVAGNRLGVLNHALLTLRAAEAAKIPVHAVVLTQLSEHDLDLAMSTNYDALVTLLPRYRVFRFPWVDHADDPDALAAAAAASGLDALLAASLIVPTAGALSFPN